MTSPLDDQLAAYAQALRTSPHNLLSSRALEALEDRHLPECLALARLLPDGPAALVDVGSGGGLPGLVIALARPDLRVTLVESTGKKADFLATTAAELGVRVAVANGRAEELGTGVLSERFDLATARALAPLDRLVGWTLPLLRPGGRLFAVKGERWEQELRDAHGDLRRSGARVIATPPDPRAYTEDVDPPLRVVIIEA